MKTQQILSSAKATYNYVTSNYFHITSQDRSLPDNMSHFRCIPLPGSLHSKYYDGFTTASFSGVLSSLDHES